MTAIEPAVDTTGLTITVVYHGVVMIGRVQGDTFSIEGHGCPCEADKVVRVAAHGPDDMVRAVRLRQWLRSKGYDHVRVNYH